ncbi:MAG: UDP-N-acetylglucosamine 2-epimerase (non-hydrolyzing) [Candidatus Methanomethylicia archaeon]|nr:UDP-N-acetylglucosamine 2-epimerase (non-hydrolyzing) [Candidatus Methanomethylicia archaeon]
MKVAVVLGTRPEIIKMSPIIRELQRRRGSGGEIEYFILHTGQHYSYNMDRVFFEQLNLPQPRFNLNVGSGTHAKETGRMMMGIERVLLEEKPDLVLVEGDTNTVLSGALASVKVGVEVGHVEAGLRSFDRSMPEEINRIVADHVSEILFAPTEKAKQNLISEGISQEKIHVTGNTIVDAVHQNLELARRGGSAALESLGLEDGRYFLATVHRQENVDDPVRLRGILEGLRLVHDHYGMPVVYPAHPRSRKMMGEHGLDPEGIILTDPLDYLSFLRLESGARLIFTDSGGVQEEACILKVPCVTLRDNTERPETLEVGANTLAGTDPERILERARLMIDCKRRWSNPFGDGRAGERIVGILERIIGEDPRNPFLSRKVDLKV